MASRTFAVGWDALANSQNNVAIGYSVHSTNGCNVAVGGWPVITKEQAKVPISFLMSLHRSENSLFSVLPHDIMYMVLDKNYF